MLSPKPGVTRAIYSIGINIKLDHKIYAYCKKSGLAVKDCFQCYGRPSGYSSDR
jgi:hypothetical protein